MTTTPLTKAEAIAAFGGNQAALARALEISRQRVHKFVEGPLPERYDLKLRFVVFPRLGIRISKVRPDQSSTDVDTSEGACESENSDFQSVALARRGQS
jgi:hypothetical protein